MTRHFGFHLQQRYPIVLVKRIGINPEPIQDDSTLFSCTIELGN